MSNYAIGKIKSAFRRLRTGYWTWRAYSQLHDRPTGLRVNLRSTFTQNTKIGDDCHFNGMRIEGQGRVEIDDHFHSGREILMITESHNYHGTALPYDSTTLVKNIEIGRNVWLGTRVTILGGVKIGEGAIVQAGSVVVQDVEPLAIVGGAPAKKFKTRDAKHYAKLSARDD